MNHAARMLASVVLIVSVLLPVHGKDEERAGSSGPLFPVDAYGEGWMTSDRNEDGRIDYALQLQDGQYKSREALDHNFDGFMDGFYFYARDVLVRQEVDSNYDGAIDLWVYLHEGVYVEGYERDTDYDGEVDFVKRYGPEN